MAAPVQPISNGAISIQMSAVPGASQPVQPVMYQQQPVVVAGAAPMAYAPRKPYIRHPNEEHW